MIFKKKKPEYEVICSNCGWKRLNWKSPRSGWFLAGTNSKVSSEDSCPKCGHNGGLVGPSEYQTNIKKNKIMTCEEEHPTISASWCDGCNGKSVNHLCKRIRGYND